MLIFLFNLQYIILNQQQNNLYAQDPNLFDNTWYFVSGELDGEIFFQPPEEHNIEVNFNNNEIYLCYPSCDECYNNEVDITGDTFIVSENEPWIVLIGNCNPPQNDYIGVHNSVYFYNHQTSKNPFNYSIETVEDYLQLTITNGVGDFAIYNSVFLDTPKFDNSSFNIYPNPVQETLHINHNFNQSVTVSIYDIGGKKLVSDTLESKVSTINVKDLNSGLYFVIFNNEAGESLLKRFIKK
ncbi:T9SS type A sorting domain-containing protein [Aequorivita sp. KMM 9714]|uniref:T9SS type A sorting domain-containing protein n=1 Tax=Aequorivita sp. KMM 9714 TaxID=2707173 RepID=UPI0013EBC8BC|nr:T9SS type A sorting domain-containing protein [Aequorivita sp. KMM 9714]NGX84524.1 T9SS type A sorting domain-containing protein [Aequorivita sp. KMM 9714]